MSHFSFTIFHPRKYERIHQLLQVLQKMPYGLSTTSNKARSLQASGEQLPGLMPVSPHPAFESFIGIDKIRKVSTFKMYFLHCKKLHSLKIKMNKTALCTDGDSLILWVCTHSPLQMPALFINFSLSLYCLKTYPFPFPAAHRRPKKRAACAPVPMKRRKYSHVNKEQS